jgi:hypothetical protein
MTDQSFVQYLRSRAVRLTGTVLAVAAGVLLMVAWVVWPAILWGNSNLGIGMTVFNLVSMVMVAAVILEAFVEWAGGAHD